jgi:hypothetical protein
MLYGYFGFLSFWFRKMGNLSLIKGLMVHQKTSWLFHLLIIFFLGFYLMCLFPMLFKVRLVTVLCQEFAMRCGFTLCLVSEKVVDVSCSERWDIY